MVSSSKEMKKNKKVLITAGPTYEELDQVRRITNHSTGKLGAEMAKHLKQLGTEVYFLRGYYAIDQSPVEADQLVTFTTTQDLALKLQGLASAVGDIDLVLHAAAVSDFKVGKILSSAPGSNTSQPAETMNPHQRPGKLGTRSGSFWVEMVPTLKILPNLAKWFSGASVVGWKYEVDGEEEDVWQKACQQVEDCQTQACVVNGPAYGKGFGLYWPDGKRQEIGEDVSLLLDSLLAGLDPDASMVSK